MCATGLATIFLTLGGLTYATADGAEVLVVAHLVALIPIWGIAVGRLTDNGQVLVMSMRLLALVCMIGAIGLASIWVAVPTIAGRHSYFGFSLAMSGSALVFATRAQLLPRLTT